ncbi:unnamed protein product [Cuscuta campestris]|uniref:CCHC-type domain-containing protein n=1 Tax=Cuscuta campestris TaxID=132261 RepID=A0A484NJ53_9ASTE|nr:unnamed protein product [Cuscuta campestris]
MGSTPITTFVGSSATMGYAPVTLVIGPTAVAAAMVTPLGPNMVSTIPVIPSLGPNTGVFTSTPVGHSTVMLPANSVKEPTKFTGVDFKIWQQRMLFWLTTLNLARYLREDPPVVGENADEPTVQAKEAWIANNYTCLNLILNCLSDALYAVYSRAASAKELWTTLSNKYQAEDAGAKKFIVGKVLDFKMVDSKPVVSQAEELILIFNECTNEGMGVSEAFQVAEIIYVLLPAWDEFRSYLKLKRKEMTLEQLLVRLRIREEGLTREKKVAVAKAMWWSIHPKRVLPKGPSQIRTIRKLVLKEASRRPRIGKGQSTSLPPLFDGTNYSYWKERMRIYIRSTNFQLWLVIKNGEEIPMKKVDDKLIPKTEDEFDAEDIKKIENYAKAINMLYCAVNLDDYRKISCCTTAKEMWNKLEVTYEGADQVRVAKIDFLTQEYEMFRMKEGEKIDDMFDRFSKIINDLHALKKTYANKDLVRKILRSLTPEWRSKADAIYESIGVSNVTIDGLRGNLKTYEYTILTPSLDEQKKKGIALKATKETVEEVSSDDDNEFWLVIKKFNKFMKKEFEWKGRKHDGPPKCYGCGEICHIKPRCPKAKHGKDKPGFKKQRAYISWGGDSGDESTDQEEDEAANLCLMAHEDQNDDVEEASSVLWYLDSKCSKHMTGDASKLLGKIS